MRLTVAPDNLAERVGLWSGMLPTALVLASYGPACGRAIVAGARLGFYDALGHKALSPEALAEATGCDATGAAVLARALVGFGLLTWDGTHFRNTRATRRWLLTASRHSLRDSVLFLGFCQDWMMDMEEAVRTGRVARLHDREHPPEFWSAYMGGLGAFAKVGAAEIVRRAGVKPRRILDVGGGHGVYAAAFCERFGAQATVLDLPGACAVGRARFAHPAVTWQEGDARSEAWGEGYDLVLLFNVLHNTTAQEGPPLLARAQAALAPGGSLLICEAAHTDRLTANEAFGELFFFVVSAAQAWPAATLRAWAEAAGLRHKRTVNLVTNPAVLMRFVREG